MRGKPAVCAMAMRFIACTWLWLAGLWTATPASAQTRVAVDSQNAPFMMAQGQQAAGLYPLLIHAGFQRLGTPVRIDAVPWSRALELLDRGEAGVGGIYRNSERLAKFDFSAPIFVERLLLYGRRDRPLPFRTLDDLAGLRIGVVRGWSYGDAFDEARRHGRMRVEEVASDAQNFSKLESGRLDLVVAVEQAGSAQLASGAFPAVVALSQPLAVNPTHLAFHKSAGMKGLLLRFDRAMQELRRTGEHERLVIEALRP